MNDRKEQKKTLVSDRRRLFRLFFGEAPYNRNEKKKRRSLQLFFPERLRIIETKKAPRVTRESLCLWKVGATEKGEGAGR